MATRLAFVHTVGFLADTFRRLMREEQPNIDCFHILNESLLQDILRGVPKTEVYRRVTEQVILASDAQADLIVVTCSSISPAVDIARLLVGKPVLKIDGPMAAEAVKIGTRIGLLCTAASTLKPSSALLKAHAEEQGRTIALITHVNSDAYTALMAGDRERHDLLVRQSALELSTEVDVLVLAQASLAHLREELTRELPCAVLASPPLLMRELAQRLASR